MQTTEQEFKPICQLWVLTDKASFINEILSLGFSYSRKPVDEFKTIEECK